MKLTQGRLLMSYAWIGHEVDRYAMVYYVKRRHYMIKD